MSPYAMKERAMACCLVFGLLSFMLRSCAVLDIDFFITSNVAGNSGVLGMVRMGRPFLCVIRQLAPTAIGHFTPANNINEELGSGKISDKNPDEEKFIAVEQSTIKCLARESFLHDQCKYCEKNPLHQDFIAVKDFTKGCLPKECQDSTIVTFASALAAVTVRLRVRYTSKRRPVTDINYKNRDTDCLRTGSGWIAQDSETEQWSGSDRHTDSTPCDCAKCSASDSPKTEYGILTIWTACHVVFDNSEAKKTEVDVIVDNEVFELYGLEVNYCCQDGDRCGLKCVAHSVKLWDRLKELSRRRCDAGNVIEPSRYLGVNLALHVSFPHGLEKTISLGKWTERKVVKYESDPTAKKHKDKDRTEYKYNTMTCPGGSGGPVWILPKEVLPSTVHPHSGVSSEDERVGESGVGWL